MSAAQRKAAVEAHVLALLTECALAGRRCPMLDEIAYSLSKAGLPYGKAASAVPELARAGKIRIEVSAQNYRVVMIAAGPHKGAETLRPPGNPQPYLVIKPGGEVFRRGDRRPRA